MRGFRGASDRDLAWEWGRAETDSLRFSDDLRAMMTKQIRGNLDANRRDSMSESEWRRLSDAIVRFRSPLLDGLNELGVTWLRATLMLGELCDLRLMSLPKFQAVSPTLLLSEFTTNLERGVMVPGDPGFMAGYRALRDGFDFTSLRGSPVLVCEARSGPYTILEGYTRLSALCTRHSQRTPVPTAVEVLLGVCERLSEWRLYDWRTRQPTPLLLAPGGTNTE